LVGNVVAAKQSLDPPFEAGEVADVLRRWFDVAPPDAQLAFLAHLREGPEASYVSAVAEWQGEDVGDDEVVREIVEAWQRRRLRWFHDSIPAALAELADALSIREEVPTARQQDLDEVGFHSGGVSWRGDSSPIGADALVAMPLGERLQYLVAWQAGDAGLDRPTVEGLADTLRSLIAEAPVDHAEFLSLAAVANELNPRIRSAMLSGLKRAADQDLSLPWTEAISLCRETVRLAGEHRAEADSEWLWARNDAVELISVITTKDLLPQSFRDEVFVFTRQVLLTSPDWPSREVGASTRFGDVVHGLLNWEAGKSTYLLLCVALWGYRNDAEDWMRDHGEGVEALLDFCVARSDPGRVAARARLGEFLPQLLLLRSEWVDRVQSALFVDGMSRPLEEPAFSAYLVLSRWNSRAFALMKPWLIEHVPRLAALRAAEDRSEERSDDWSVAKHFLERVGTAFLHGHVGIHGDDGLMASTFAASRPTDRSHFYWQIFRGWTDSLKPPDEGYVDRVCTLWRWRLEARDSDDSDQSAEDDGLVWLFLTPHLPHRDVIQLGEATFEIAAGDRSIRGMVWPRLAELCASDVAAVVRIATKVIESELAGDWPYLNTAEVRPVLAAGLSADDPGTRDQARWLVNLLGDRGWTEFGELLD
jgi:hypothetical protein